MLLIDSNIFIYARGTHTHSPDCRDFISSAGEHTDWLVPFLIVLEVTHYYADGGAYTRKILDVFPTVDTRVEDFEWAVDHAPSHGQLNDHILLHSAHRLGCRKIVSYDAFFETQSFFDRLRSIDPASLD